MIFFKSGENAAAWLDLWLTQNGIGRLIIGSIRTEQICETTMRHASDLGFKVDDVTDATLMFEMQLADSSLFAAADIKARTVAVLKDQFARICSVGEGLQTP